MNQGLQIASLLSVGGTSWAYFVLTICLFLVGCTGFSPSSSGPQQELSEQISPSPNPVPAPSPSPSPSPTTFEGYGALTRGAEDCANYQTIRVTNLNDSGVGSLRSALSGGCRKVVFDISGEITLQSTLNIRHSFITIDGSSAPEPGITIVHPNINVGMSIVASNSIGPVHDVIVHHLRHVAPGGHSDTTSGLWGLDGEAHPVYNIVLDHITASGSNDGVFDLWGRVYNVTISWNLIMDTYTASHTAPLGSVRENLSYHHNVFARNNERQIKIKYDSRADFVNNIIYGWGWFECAARGLNIDTTEAQDPTINVVSNLFHYVPGLPCGTPNDAIVYTGNGLDDAKVFMSGNIVPAGETDAVSTSPVMVVPVAAQVTTYSANTLKDTVLPFAGTHYPTAVEQELVNQIRNEL